MEETCYPYRFFYLLRDRSELDLASKNERMQLDKEKKKKGNEIYNVWFHMCSIRLWATLCLQSQGSNTASLASTEYITVIIARIPKINDPRGVLGGKYSWRITETDVVILAPWQKCHDVPPAARATRGIYTGGRCAITRISNASQKRVPEQTPIRLTANRSGGAPLFFQF